jgi:excisionase family DNA binding protein
LEQQPFPIAQLAKRLCVSERTARRIVEGRELKVHRIGRRWRVFEPGFQNYLSERANRGNAGAVTTAALKGAGESGNEQRLIAIALEFASAQGRNNVGFCLSRQLSRQVPGSRRSSTSKRRLASVGRRPRPRLLATA